MGSKEESSSDDFQITFVHDDEVSLPRPHIHMFMCESLDLESFCFVEYDTRTREVNSCTCDAVTCACPAKGPCKHMKEIARLAALDPKHYSFRPRYKQEHTSPPLPELTSSDEDPPKHPYACAGWNPYMQT